VDIQRPARLYRITYKADGTSTSRQFSYPFGGIRNPGGAPVVDTDVGFTGQRLDETTGLMFYQARYYDPVTARFISADTMIPDPGNPQDFNRYTYVRNNPVAYTDPSGNCSRIAKQMENAAAEQGVSIDLGSGDDCPDSFTFWGDVRNIGKGIIDTPANLVNLNLRFAEVTDRWFVMSPTGGGPVGFAYRRWFGDDSDSVRVPTLGADPGYEAEYLAGSVIGPAVWAKGLKLGGAFASRIAARFGTRAASTPMVRGPAGLFGNNPTKLRTLNTGSYVEDAGQGVQQVQTSLGGGLRGAEEFYSLQTGATNIGLKSSMEGLDGLTYAIYRSGTGGTPTVSVFDAVAATLEKIRFGP
jgi:RHS repeat-associated protein